VGRQICAAGCASGAPKPASTTTTAFQTRQSQKKNPPGKSVGLEVCTGGVSAGPKPRAILERMSPIVSQFTFARHSACYPLSAGGFQGPSSRRRRDTIFRARRRSFFDDRLIASAVSSAGQPLPVSASCAIGAGASWLPCRLLRPPIASFEIVEKSIPGLGNSACPQPGAAQHSAAWSSARAFLKR
jgi:hypothetical protein